MKKLLFSSTILSSLLLNSTAYAANDAELDATVKQLQAQVQALQAQIKTLEPLIEREQARDNTQKLVMSNRRLSELEPAANYEAMMQDVERVKPCKKKGCDVKVSLKPAPIFATRDGTKTFEVHGLLQGDAAWIDDDAVDHSNGTNMHRARLAVKGKVDDWGYKFETDFADDDAHIKDAYLDYKGFKNVTFRAGQFKEPFGLEALTSNRFTTFLERAAVKAFAPSRNIGVSVATGGNQWTLTAGVFGAGTGDASSDDEENAVTARATYAPIAEANKVLHLGVAGSYRKPDSATDALIYSSSMESAIPALKSVKASISGVDDSTLLGLEAAAVWNWFSLQGEYIRSDVNRQAMPDATMDGHYVQASAFLTGESRNYKQKYGKFDRVKPNNPFNPKAGTWGAWEVAARYSNLDLNDGSVAGGEMTNYSFALNWYPHANVRIMTNYIIVDTDENAVTSGDDPQVFTVRGQIDF